MFKQIWFVGWTGFIILVATPAVAQCPLTITTYSHTEDFDTTTYLDSSGTSAVGWNPTDGAITMGNKSAGFSDRQAGNFAHRIVTLAAANWDQDVDDLDDIIALVVRVNRPQSGGTYLPDSCELYFFRNKGMSGDTHLGFESGEPVLDWNGDPIVPEQCSDTAADPGKGPETEGAVLKAGDIDGDGTMDLMFGSLDKRDEEGQPKQFDGTYRYQVWRGCGDGNALGLGCGAISLAAGASPQFSLSQSTMGPANMESPEDPLRYFWNQDAIQLVHWNTDPADGNGYNVNDRVDLLVATHGHTDSWLMVYYGCQRFDAVNCNMSQDFGNTYGFGWNWKSTALVVEGGSGPTPGRSIVIGDGTNDNHLGFTTNYGAGSGHEIPMPDTSCPPSHSRGATVVLPGDFDQDGDLDVVLGSMSETDLRYFDNGGALPLTYSTDITFSEFGPAYGVVVDYNLDTYPDIVIAGDKYGCNASDGRVWVLENTEGSFNKPPLDVVDLGNDVDWMVKLDADGDGNMDVMAGRGIEESPYYILFPRPVTVHAPSATAQSLPIADGLDLALDSIVSVTAAAAVDTVDVNGDLTDTDMWVSNTGGDTWEKLSSDEEPWASPGPPATHNFTDFGASFAYKILLEHEEVLVPPDDRFAPGTKNPPDIDSLTFSYDVIVNQPVYFTRSALAYGLYEDGGTKEVIFTAYNEYPGYKADLTAFEITGCVFTNTTLTSEACLGDPWGTTAGGDLENTDSKDRVFYTAWDDTEAGNPVDERVELEKDGGALNPTEIKILGTSDTDDLEFVRKGMSLGGNPQWKFYDVGHSSPVFVGPPLTDFGSCLDPGDTFGFSAFAGLAAGRREMVYLGANDGAVHAFRAKSGDEEWVFVPYNLASRLKDMRSPADEYIHRNTMDGPIVVQDIYNTTAGEFQTVLFGGQARGIGRDNENYYFALNVTDPQDPQPMWEFTDDWENKQGECDGDPEDWVCTLNCGSDTCSTACNTYSSVTTAIASAGATYVDITVSDWNDWPATGVVEMARADALLTEHHFYSKSATSGRLDLEDSTGGSATLINPLGLGDELQRYRSYIYAEQNDRVVIEAENYMTAKMDSGSVTGWHTETTDTPAGASAGRSIFANNGTYPDADPGICRDGPGGADPSADFDACAPSVNYTIRFDMEREWDMYTYVNFPGGSQDSYHWGMNGEWEQRQRKLPGGSTGVWGWIETQENSAAGINDPLQKQLMADKPGVHTLNLFRREVNGYIDKIVLLPKDTLGVGVDPSLAWEETCEEVCDPLNCTETCSKVTVGNPATDDWVVDCGVGNQCCAVPDTVDDFYCAPTAELCSNPGTSTGETWSPPQIGRFKIQGFDRWLVVFGSGYNSNGHYNAGRSVYFVDAGTGALVAKYNLGDIDEVSPLANIENAVPGGVTLVDMQDCDTAVPEVGCGYIDRIYVGDLDGQLWKIDTFEDAALGGDLLVDPTSWPSCVVFDAGDPDGDTVRSVHAPIITKPAVAQILQGTANVYFGTGGDDEADAGQIYRFYSIRDNDVSGSGACSLAPLNETDLGYDEAEWIVGDDRMNDGSPLSTGTLFADATLPADYTSLGPPSNGAAANWEGMAGDRYWADPIVVNGVLVAIASLNGKIESVNPCENIDGGGSNIYLYAIRRFRDQSGTTYQPGDRYLARYNRGKVRQAVLVRGNDDSLAFNQYGTCGMSRYKPLTNQDPKDLIVQQAVNPADPAQPPPAETIAQIGGVTLVNGYKILRWREIPL